MSAKAAELDQRATWLQCDDSEATPLEWTDRGTLAVRIMTAGMAESVLGEMVDAATVTMRTRYRSDIAPPDRLVWKGTTYEVTGIRYLGRREMLEIDARAVSYRVLS